ncbi:MAG TPA: hypothetical protein VEY10_05735 [Flavisolibacter sp.]|jgi:hypothetical protein|nr:hypothetical protein [Flavisolibacter sp.]
MRKVVKVVVALAIIILNMVAVAPHLFKKAVEPKENCVLQQPTLQITEMTPVIIPSLFKVS